MLFTGSAFSGSTQAARPAAAPFANVQVSHDSYPAHSEPDIVENPANPDNLVAGSKMFTDPAHYRFQIGTYYSMNGGRTWHDTGFLPGFDSFDLTSDISFAFSPNGSLVYACVLADTYDNQRSGIFVSRSRDGGKTWSQPVAVYLDTTGNTFSDKAWIAVDTSHSPNRGTVYVAWNLDPQSSGGNGDPGSGRLRARAHIAPRNPADYPIGIVVARSTDYGKTFSAPVVVRKFGTQSQNFALSAYPAVAPNGNLYVAYITWDSARVNGKSTTVHRLDVAESRDGGQTFTVRTAVSHVDALPDKLPNSTFRNFSMPVLGISPVDGAMVLVWPDMRNGDADILAVHSTNGGKTWSAPIRVNHDPVHDGKDQFQPAIAVAPNGTFTCAWFDRRFDPGNRLIDEEIAQSTDDGKSFGVNVRVTKSSWDPAIGAPKAPGGVTFIGDYQGVAADNTTVHPLWNDTQNGTSQQIRSTAVAVTILARR